MTISGTLQAEQASANRRGAARRKLNLEVTGEAGGVAGNVTLLNLSASGVLLRTAVRLAIGERIRLAFPDDTVVAAKVVWTSEDLFGCRFEKTVGRATLSAASLRGTFDEPQEESAPTAVEETFGGRVERMRRQRGLSLQALASKIGVSKPALWKWERGEVRPRPAALARLAETLGVSASELMFGGATASTGDAGQPNSLRVILDGTKAQVAKLLGVTEDAVEVTVSVSD